MLLHCHCYQSTFSFRRTAFWQKCSCSVTVTSLRMPWDALCFGTSVLSCNGGFFPPRLRGVWENVRSFLPRLRYFFFKVDIRSRALTPLFMPGSVHSGSASCDDRGRMFSDKLRMSSFSDRFPHYAWAAA